MFIEGVLLKGSWAIIKGLSLVLIAIYAIFFDRKKLSNIFHDDSFETTMDLLTVSLYSYCAYLKVMFGGVPIHSICDALFFYVGGFTGLGWGIYRFLNERKTFKKNKKEEEEKK